MAARSPPGSSPATSVTATEPVPTSDIEAGQANFGGVNKPTHVSHWQLVFRPSGLTPEVRNFQFPGEGTAESPYVVSFLDVDPYNPMQYGRFKKWMITIVMAFAALAVSFVSSAYSGGLTEIIIGWHISDELAILGISLFVMGFAVGPLMWAPASEFWGRQLLFSITYFCLTAFCGACAAAQNIWTLVILRFFAGAFGSSPLTNAGGVIADMFTANERGMAMAIFAAAPFLGPSLGPIAGGFLGDAGGWRWVEGMLAIFSGVMLVIGGLLVPETYAPVLLRKRAVALSKLTGKVYTSKLDVHQAAMNKALGLPPPTMKSQFKVALLRPWVLLFREPIVMILSLYTAIVYGTMYMMFPAFPIVFQQTRGWSAGISGLAFLGITVGMIFAVSYAMYDNKRYNRVAAAAGGFAPPEARLHLAVIGCILIPVGLFWFAWTNEAPVHWIVPIIGSGFFACGIVLVFLSLLGYLIDAYVVYAASVLAANSVLRSLFGAAFPLFTTYMYHNLGLHWASSVPAFLALACVPAPILLQIYGARIRMSCKYAAEAAQILQRLRNMSAPPAQPADASAEDPEAQAVAEAEEAERERREEQMLEKKATRMSQASRASHRRSIIDVIRHSVDRSGGSSSAAAPAQHSEKRVDDSDSSSA